MEFVECKDKMTFEFDMDHISDDWIILMTLIGNDYVPGLPNFTLDHNVLTMIYDAYKTVLQTSNGMYGFESNGFFSVLKIIFMLLFGFWCWEKIIFRLHERVRVFEFASFCSADT